EHTLPEVDRRPAVRADDRDVVHALALELAHYLSSCSTSFDLYSLRCKVPHGTSSTLVWTTRTLRSRARIAAARAASTEAPPLSSSAFSVTGLTTSACTKSRAPRCIPSCSSHSPHNETPMSPIPIASVTHAPHPPSSFARNARSPPPGSPATRTRSTLDARR